MTSGYASFLSWFYGSSSTLLKGPARQWPYKEKELVNLGPKMITVTQEELNEKIKGLRHTETVKRVTFDPMNDMTAELHLLFKKKKMGIYSVEEIFEIV